MEKNILKKTVSLCAALVMCTGAVACKKSESKPTASTVSESSASGTNPAETAKKIATTSFCSEALGAIKNTAAIGDVKFTDDNSVLICSYDWENYDPKLYKTDSSFSEFNEIAAEIPDEYYANPGENSALFTIAGDGTFYAVINNVTHGNQEIVDFASPDFNSESFDYEAYANSAINNFIFCRFDSSGKLLSKNPIDWLTPYGEEDSYFGISSFICGDDGTLLLALVSGEIFIIDNVDGAMVKPIDMDGVDLTFAERPMLLNDRDGKCAVFYSVPDGRCISCIDIESAKIDGDVFKTTDSAPFSFPIAGISEYKFFFSATDSLYGIKEDGSTKKVINWVDSSINVKDCKYIIPISSDEFIIAESKDNDNLFSFSRLTPRSEDEMENETLITLAYGDGDERITALVNDFNKSHSDCRISIVPCDNDELKLQYASGKAPDIVFEEDYSMIERLAANGAFTDLYQFMDNDDKVNRDAILPNVLKACESSDGKLYSIPTMFDIYSIFTKKKFIDKENWTLDEMIETFDNAPESMTHLYDSIENMDLFRKMLEGNSEFVDYENASCSFDSPEFIKLLEFCKRFPSELDIPDKNNDPNAFSQYYTDAAHWLKDEKQLIDVVWLESFNSYTYVKNSTFKDDISFVGFPSSDGKGGSMNLRYTIAISESSPCKDFAWEFIRSVFCSSLYSDMEEYTFPTYKESFYEFAEYAIAPDFISEDKLTGNQLSLLTQEELNEFIDYILTIEKIGVTSIDKAIYDICEEEALAYFAGEHTAKETAEMIQNRASIVISEQS